MFRRINEPCNYKVIINAFICNTFIIIYLEKIKKSSKINTKFIEE